MAPCLEARPDHVQWVLGCGGKVLQSPAVVQSSHSSTTSKLSSLWELHLFICYLANARLEMLSAGHCDRSSTSVSDLACDFG